MRRIYFKRCVCLFLAVLMLMMVCACGNVSDTDLVSETAVVSETVENTDTETKDVAESVDTPDVLEEDSDEAEESQAVELTESAESDTDSEGDDSEEIAVSSEVSEIQSEVSESSSENSSSENGEAQGETTIITYYTTVEGGGDTGASDDVLPDTAATAADLSNESDGTETYTSEFSNPYEGADESEWIDLSWFDDAVLVGDSITLKLSYYCADHAEALGNAKFLCAGSLGYANSQMAINAANNVHPYYNGQKVLTEYCAEVTGAKKVIIGLGMNDIGYGLSYAIGKAQSLIEKIQANSPDAEIYIESVTPIYYFCQKTGLNNELVREFNSLLAENAEGWGCKFIDTYSALCDTNGNLPYEYCSDTAYQGIHFTDAACEVWVECLKSSIGALVQ